MLYHSTRNKTDLYASKDAILKGICEDGGLFVSDDLGKTGISVSGLENKTYTEIAAEVLSILIPDYTDEEIEFCINNAYNGKFETEDLTPLTPIGENYLLELYHGPTQAFKDLALCMLPQFMSVALKDRKRKVMILTATSGDTGKAALAGFADAENIGITVFFPHEKVSDIQYLQMVTQKGGNVSVAAVRGNFDDCQTEVKNIFSRFSSVCEKKYGVSLSSANSINVGRLVPQVVYYFEAYRQLLKRNAVKPGEQIDFCVPTGNFGDILAGWYAKQLGLPVRKLIVASNENNVLFDFLKTGVYDRNREFIKTISPSMDILISSNLERLLYYVSGGDCDAVVSWMNDLKEKGQFRIPENILNEILKDFDFGYADNKEASRAISEAYHTDGRLIDPHTAVAYKVAEEYKKKQAVTVKTVILSTASPFKFARDVYSAIFGDEGAVSGFEYMKKLSERTGEPAPAQLTDLVNAPILHDSVVCVSEMESFVESAAGKE